MFKVLLFFFITFLFSLIYIFAQEEEIFIETFYEDASEDFYDEQQIDAIEYYRANPINLYEISPRRLTALPGIDYTTAKAIIKLAKKEPTIKTSQIADSLNLSAEVELLLKYCTQIIVTPSPQTKLLYKARSKYRFEQTKGFEDERFVGDELDLYQTLRFSSKYVSAGAITKKNPGEKELNEYMSGYCAADYSNIRLMAGDYTAMFGQGLIFGRTFAPRKGFSTVSPALLRSRGVQAYHSTIDYKYLRGLALIQNIDFSKNFAFSYTLAYSDTDKSATIDKETGLVSSIYTSGYYRTENEVSKKNILNEKAILGNAEFKIYNLALGVNYLNLKYSNEINSSSTMFFKGKEGIAKSAYFFFTEKHINIGGEFAIDNNENKASVLGFQYLTQNLKIALNTRYIEKKYRGFYSAIFGELSSTANEMGFYTGFELKAADNIKVHSYLDIFRSIGATYLNPFPMRGGSIFVQTDYRHSSKSISSIRFKFSNKTNSKLNDALNRRIYYENIKNSLRLEHFEQLSKTAYCRFRFEYIHSNENFSSAKSGAVIFAEASEWFLEFLQLTARLTLFSTDDYDTALRQYEYIAPAYFYTAPLYGEGIRTLVKLRIQPYKNIGLNISYVNTTKNNIDYIGSSYDQIKGNKDNRLIMQIDINF